MRRCLFLRSNYKILITLILIVILLLLSNLTISANNQEVYRVAYIPVKYESDSKELQPQRSIEELKERAKLVEDYYYQQSYGQVSIESIFLFDQWKAIDPTEVPDFSLKHYPFTEVPKLFDDQGREFAFGVLYKSVEKLAGLEITNEGYVPEYDAIVVVQTKGHPDLNTLEPTIYQWLSFVPQSGASDEGISPTNMIFTSDSEPFSVWAHELGHAIFKWADYYSEADYEWPRGEVGPWGIMGTGSNINPPPSIISYNKVDAGWLSWKTINNNAYGLYTIDAINKLEAGDSVLRHETDDKLQPYYIFEGRHPSHEVEQKDRWPAWYVSENQLADEPGVLIYVQKDINGRSEMYAIYDQKKYLHKKQTNAFTPTLTTGESYVCDLAGAKYSARKSDTGMEIEIKKHKPKSRNIYRMFLTTPDSFVNGKDALLNYDFINEIFDVDLKVYSTSGEKVGMDYKSGEYLIEIPGARASGNIPGGGPEWISVPDDIEIEYMIDTTPAKQRMSAIGLKEVYLQVELQKVNINEHGDKAITDEQTIPLDLIDDSHIYYFIIAVLLIILFSVTLAISRSKGIN